MILVKDIKLPPEKAADVKKAAAKKLAVSEDDITDIKILRRSIDARKKPMYIFTAAVSLRNEKNVSGERYEGIKPIYIKKAKFRKRPVIAGFGPAGMFAALMLARAGAMPLVLEQGKSVEERKRDVAAFFSGGELCESSNIQFGEGGAGTFSDGKLATGIKSRYIKNVLGTFVEFGAKEDILIDAKPHIGSDVLPRVVTNIRKEIERLGGEVKFETTLEDIITDKNVLCGVKTDKGEIETDTLFLAVGHSAGKTFGMLQKNGVRLESKPFSVGCRIEHLQKDISRAQYGAASKILPPADYKLACHLKNGFSVYTFCMCPGGYVVNSGSEKGGIVTNGYSESRRDGKNANSALLVGVSPEVFGDDPLGGIEFQRKIEKAAFDISGSFKAPCQLVGDFLQGKESRRIGDIEPTFSGGVTLSDISLCLPRFAAESLREGIRQFATRLHGFDRYDAVLTAPETRSSSPVRIVRDKESMQSEIKGIYPIGEGSGYAGGITSSAIDGIYAAEKAIELNLGG